MPLITQSKVPAVVSIILVSTFFHRPDEAMWVVDLVKAYLYIKIILFTRTIENSVLLIYVYKQNEKPFT